MTFIETDARETPLLFTAVVAAGVFPVTHRQTNLTGLLLLRYILIFSCSGTVGF